MENNKFLRSAALILIGLVAGYFLTTFVLSPSASCPAPLNLRLESKSDTSLRFSWDAASDANYYTIEVRDSTQIDSIYRLLITQDATITLKGLKSGNGYAVRVSTVCDVSQNKAFISPLPSELGARTDYIVIDEIPPTILPGVCSLDVCDIAVTVQSNGCFNLDAGEVFYQVEITDAAGTPVRARNLFKKWADGLGRLKVHPYASNPCSSTGPATINPALRSNCAPVEGNKICGSFVNGAATITYSLTFIPASGGTPDQCCVQISAPGYTVTAAKCQSGDIVK